MPRLNILQLPPRLQALADLVPQDARLADIGTDHGYLPIALLQQGRIRAAIASDIHHDPLCHARESAQEYGLADRISFRLCDGLSAIAAEEVDTVLIAGMGGETMIDILRRAPWTKKGCTILLQPMTKTELLRAYLAENGYCFVSEHLVRDKDFLYVILRLRGGEAAPLRAGEIYGGVALSGDPLYGEYLAERIAKLRRALAGLNAARRPDCAARAEMLSAVIAELSERARRLSAERGETIESREGSDGKAI